MLQALEEAIPSRIVFESETMMDFAWTARMPRLRYLAVRGPPIHVDALTPLLRAVHATHGIVGDKDPSKDDDDQVVEFAKIAEAMPHLAVLVVQAPSPCFVSGYAGIETMTSLVVLDVDIASLPNDKVIDLRPLDQLRVVHFESDEDTGGILLPSSVETFVDIEYKTFIRDGTFAPGTHLHALAISEAWVLHCRTAPWWDDVWKTVRVGCVFLSDAHLKSYVRETPKRTKVEAAVKRMLPGGPPMRLFVFAGCEVHLVDAIKELDVFAHRATEIRVIREFHEEHVDDEQEGVFETDDLMLAAIREVCPDSHVSMHTTDAVDRTHVWKVVRPYMKPPSVPTKQWDSICYR